MPDDRLINDADFRTVLNRRKFTLRKRLKTRIASEDVPEENDELVIELRVVRKLSKMIGNSNA